MTIIKVCFKDKTAKINSGDIDILPVVRGPGKAIIKKPIQFWRSNYCFRFFFPFIIPFIIVLTSVALVTSTVLVYRRSRKRHQRSLV
jgi:hypothetical protein